MNMIGPQWSLGFPPGLELKGKGVVEDRLEGLSLSALQAAIPFLATPQHVNLNYPKALNGPRASESSRSLASRQAWTRAASGRKGARKVPGAQGSELPDAYL